MSWIVFAVGSVVFLSISNLFQKVLMNDENSDAHSYSIVFQLLAAIFVGIFAVIKGFIMPPFSDLVLNFILLAVLYGLGTLFIFNALRYIEASEVTIITASRSLVTILSAIWLLGESFDFKKAFGTAFILIAVVLISGKFGKLKFNKGFLYAIAMAICYGLAVTNDAYVLRYVDVFSYTAIGFLLPGLFLILIKPAALVKIPLFFKPKVLWRMILLSVFYGTAAIFFYSAINTGAKASQIAPINQSAVILTVILAAIFLGEKDQLIKKIISAFLVTFGVLLIK